MRQQREVQGDKSRGNKDTRSTRYPHDNSYTSLDGRGHGHYHSNTQPNVNTHLREEVVNDVRADVVVDIVEDAVVVVAGRQATSHVRPRASSEPRYLTNQAA